MVDEVSSVSQQTAAEATNVSAASEEQASSLSEASQNIQQLSQLADRLDDNVADFDVGGQQARSGTTTEPTQPTESRERNGTPPTETDSSGNGRGSSVNTIDPDTELSAAGADGGVEAKGNGTEEVEPDQ